MSIKIVIVGNCYNSTHLIFTSVPGVLEETAHSIGHEIEATSLSTDFFSGSIDQLETCDGIFILPSPFRSLEGFYRCVQFARENMIPFLSVCGGTQYALIEFGRNVLQLKDTGHIEQEPDCKLKFVNFLPDHYRVDNDGPLKTFSIEIRSETRTGALYKTSRADEMFYANYMLAPEFYDTAAAAGLVCSGTFEDGQTPCIVEIKNHPFFIGALFQPQVNSTSESPHPLISGFLNAAAQS